MPGSKRRNLLSLFIAAFVFAAIAAPPARADCTSPAAPAGRLEYFSAAEQVFKYCNGTDWISWGDGGGGGGLWSAGAGDDIYYNSGTPRVGIGTASPAAPLHVWGEAIIGEQGLACIAATEGAIRYNSAGQVIDYCDGAAWQAIGGGGGDNLGNHTATQNILLNGFWLSNDGGNEGVFVDAAGNVGIGTTTPGAKLEVAGGVKIANDAGACTAAKEGTVRYTGSDPPWEFCDGAAWVNFKQPRCQDNDTGECYLQATRSNDDPDFIASNIREGVNLLGVTGTFKGNAACLALPIIEHFGTYSSNAFSQFTNDTGDNADFLIRSQETPSIGVGPSRDQNGQQYYAYTEATGLTAGDVLILKSDGVSLSGCETRATFYWNKRGTDMGDLYFETSLDGGPWTTQWSHLGMDVPKNETDVWRLAEVDLGNVTGTLQFRFRAVLPSSGTIWHSDIGVDTIRIFGWPDLPDSFDFTDQTDVAMGTTITSNTVTVTGLTNAVPISLKGIGHATAEYRINSGIWTSSIGTVQNGDTVTVRVTSPSTRATPRVTEITIGGFTDEWTIWSDIDCPATPGAGDEGCKMADGTFYIGVSPDGSLNMFATDASFETQTEWNDDTTNYTTTNIVSSTDGDGNTAALIAIDSDSVAAGTQPHRAAQYCSDLSAHGHTDWKASPVYSGASRC